MFDKLQQLKQLKDLQDKLSKEQVEIEKEGVKIIMNGKMEVLEVVLNSELSKEKQENVVKDCFNEAIKKIQMIAAKQMFHF